MKSETYSYFCTCPRGLEALLASELTQIARQYSTTLQVHRTIFSGVHCSGELTDAYLLNLHSRIASRVLLRMAQGSYRNEQDVYQLALGIAWEDWFDVKETIRVDLTAIKSPLKSLEFTTLKIKDAVCDRFRTKYGIRPSVNTQQPDIRISGFVDTNQCILYLDTSGEALFKRGWRTEKGEAPLRENLAAGLLQACGWQPSMPLFDPMCGSGTLLIEAAQIALGIPAGAQRAFAFERFRNFQAEHWHAIKTARGAAKGAIPDVTPQIFGSDVSGDMVQITRHNLERAQIPFEIPLKQIDAREIQVPTSMPGILLTNPPYGSRLDLRGQQDLESEAAFAAFFNALGATLKQRFAGWSIHLFSADLNLPKLLRLKETRKTVFYNGDIECRLFRFDMVEGSNRKRDLNILTKSQSEENLGES